MLPSPLSHPAYLYYLLIPSSPTNNDDLSDTSEVSPRYFEAKIVALLSITSDPHLSVLPYRGGGGGGAGRKPGCYLVETSAILVGMLCVTMERRGGGEEE